MNRNEAPSPAPGLLDHDLGMAKRSKVHPNYKVRYRVTNWRSYDRAWQRAEA